MTFMRNAGRHAMRGAIMSLGLFLSGCANYFETVFPPEEPTVLAVTRQNTALRSLPAPTQRVPVAVYSFPDLTGQYKDSEVFQTLSRAVSQGGPAMLIKALQDAGERRWFVVLDRSGLQELANERQIITEMRRQYRFENDPNPAAIAPLLHAGVILQGGIIGFDTNTQTGGFGARYLGIGGDTEWKMDTVTVSLRAISTQTGEVLASVMSQKSIVSASLRGSIFQYVAVDELLEAEAGGTTNEPKQVAVQQAIEKAVYSLIMEGAEIGLWNFSNKASGSKLVQQYRAEKYGGVVPVNAQNPVRPVTQSAASITQTRPRARPQTAAVTERQLQPDGSIKPPPRANGSEPLG